MKKRVVYKFKAKALGGQWKQILDRNNIPVTITTDRGGNAVLYIFKSKYPSIVDMYHLGETLIAEPDFDATKRMEEREAKKKEEEEEKVQGMWWND